MKKILQIEPTINNLEILEMNKCLRSTFLTENRLTRRFEKKFENFFHAKHCMAVSNWTCGLFMCLKNYGIGKGDEVIVPNLTFFATLESVVMTGATPILCDVSKEDMCINIDNVSKLISKKTKAIIPVHLYGFSCDMDKLLKLAKKKNIKVIEDAAQSMGSKYKNKYLGTLGDLGGFSFYGNKTITTGEGGIIFIKNLTDKNKLYELKNHGRNKKGIFKHKSIGYNFCFTDLQAAIGLAQFKKKEIIFKKKIYINRFYKKKLSKLKEISFLNEKSYLNPIPWFTNIIVRDKNKLRSFLNKKNIGTREIFYPLHKQPALNNNKIIKIKKNKFPISDYFYQYGLSLPSSVNISKKDLNYICKQIIKFYA